MRVSADRLVPAVAAQVRARAGRMAEPRWLRRSEMCARMSAHVSAADSDAAESDAADGKAGEPLKPRVIRFDADASGAVTQAVGATSGACGILRGVEDGLERAPSVDTPRWAAAVRSARFESADRVDHLGTPVRRSTRKLPCVSVERPFCTGGGLLRAERRGEGCLRG